MAPPTQGSPAILATPPEFAACPFDVVYSGVPILAFSNPAAQAIGVLCARSGRYGIDNSLIITQGSESYVFGLKPEANGVLEAYSGNCRLTTSPEPVMVNCASTEYPTNVYFSDSTELMDYWSLPDWVDIAAGTVDPPRTATSSSAAPQVSAQSSTASGSASAAYGSGPTQRKAAGDMQFWISEYTDKYLDDNSRTLELGFCPVAPPASWTPFKPDKIALRSATGEPLLIDSFSQFDGVGEGFPDEYAEQGGILDLRFDCQLPQRWQVYFTDADLVSIPELSSATITSDSGETVTFGPSEIPAYSGPTAG